MGELLRILIWSCIVAGVGSFVAACTANFLLQFRIDHDRVKEETGEPGWKIFGSILAPAELYKDDARAIWMIQYFGIRVAIGSFCLMLLLMLVVAVLARFIS